MRMYYMYSAIGFIVKGVVWVWFVHVYLDKSMNIYIIYNILTVLGELRSQHLYVYMYVHCTLFPLASYPGHSQFFNVAR